MNRDVQDQVVNLIIGKLPGPGMALSNNFQYNGKHLNNLTITCYSPAE